MPPGVVSLRTMLSARLGELLTKISPKAVETEVRIFKFCRCFLSGFMVVSMELEKAAKSK